MTTKHVNIPMIFMRDLLAQDVRTVMNHAKVSQYEVDALIGSQVVGSLLAPSKPDYMPTMRNYIKLCNVLDLDARKYFALDI